MNRLIQTAYQVIIQVLLDLDFLVELVDRKSEFTDEKWTELGHYSGEHLKFSFKVFSTGHYIFLVLMLKLARPH